MRLQPLLHAVTASITCGYSLCHIRLQDEEDASYSGADLLLVSDGELPDPPLVQHGQSCFCPPWQHGALARPLRLWSARLAAPCSSALPE